MTSDNVPLAVIAAASSALTGIVIKAIDFFGSKKTVEVGVEASLRNELRIQVQELRAEVVNLRLEVDGWRDKYYELVRHCGTVENDHKLLQAKYALMEENYLDLKKTTERKIAMIESKMDEDHPLK